ncbi:hypothetical protein L6164_013508 [Bauhinia variegata]|uniref:Uncharacterized protein n=1 Tax=Bauhinia variegata TaxID=167791 RepID=A0ACB9NES4_BAUVA|nr:hypothetical protein L6164_013508 [Bauhinia variegata]
MGSDEQHMVMIPFMAQGHIRPFLALAKRIHERTNFTITIANTPLNIQYLKSATSTSSGIHFAELPFNSTQHGLPPNTENTEKLTISDMPKLFHSSKSLEPHLHRLVSEITSRQGKPPLCIISDVFLGWVANVAKSLGTKNITYATGGAYGTLAYVSLWLNLPHRKTDSDEFWVPGFPENYRFQPTQLHRVLRAADGTDIWSNFFQTQIAISIRSDGWLCNSVEEIEPLGFELLRKYINLPVWPIGPVLVTDSKHIKHKVETEKFIEWLNLKEPKSVLFICFGSQNTISASQMMALAEGLELSGKSFIWVVRPPVGFDINGEFRAEWLPEGFEQRMGETNKGLLVRNWAPQLEILSHRSTGAFLSHCGWNSVLESLSRGVPIIGWPLAAEQAYNSKILMEEMGVNVELTRTVESVISGEKVKNVIELVMGSEGKGKEMKEKANENAEQIRKATMEDGEEKGSSLRAMDDFVGTILSSTC